MTVDDVFAGQYRFIQSCAKKEELCRKHEPVSWSVMGMAETSGSFSSSATVGHPDSPDGNERTSNACESVGRVMIESVTNNENVFLFTALLLEEWN